MAIIPKPLTHREYQAEARAEAKEMKADAKIAKAEAVKAAAPHDDDVGEYEALREFVWFEVDGSPRRVVKGEVVKLTLGAARKLGDAFRRKEA